MIARPFFAAFVAALFAIVWLPVARAEGDAFVCPAKGQRLVNGWRNAGLPWTAKLDRAKMYGLD